MNQNTRPRSLRYAEDFKELAAIEKRAQEKAALRNPRKLKQPSNDEPALPPRKNVALVIHAISIGTHETPQTVTFAHPVTGELLVPMKVGKVQRQAEKAHAIAVQPLSEAKQDENGARQRKRTARENFMAYFEAIDRMGGLAGLDDKIVRYGRRIQRVTAAKAAL